MRWGDAAGNFMSKAVRTGPSRDTRATFSKTRGIRSIAVTVATIMATIPNSAPKTISDVGPMPKNDQQRIKHEGRNRVIGGENRIEHATKTRHGMHRDSDQKTAQYRQADRGDEIAERVGDVRPEPGRGRDDVCQCARHLGGRDHGEAIDDPKATEQFKRNDGRTNEAELKDAHADHHTPSAFFDSSRSGAQRRPVSAAFAIRAGGASLRRAGFDRSACPSRTAP